MKKNTRLDLLDVRRFFWQNKRYKKLTDFVIEVAECHQASGYHCDTIARNIDTGCDRSHYRTVKAHQHVLEYLQHQTKRSRQLGITFEFIFKAFVIVVPRRGKSSTNPPLDRQQYWNVCVCVHYTFVSCHYSDCVRCSFRWQQSSTGLCHLT